MLLLLSNLQYLSIIKVYLLYYNLVLLHATFQVDQLNIKSPTLKIEDLKDWTKCLEGPNQILSDHKLMFKTNFNVKNIFLTSI